MMRLDNNHQYQTILKMCKSLTETLDLRRVFQVSVDSVTELVGLDTAAVYLLDKDILHLCATTPSLPPDFPDKMRYAPISDHPSVQKAIDSQVPLYIFDYLQENLAPTERAIAENRNLRTLLFVPLILKEQAMGVFIIGSIEKPKSLSDDRIDLASVLAGLSALSLKNARLFEETEKNASNLEQLMSDRIQMLEEKSRLESQLQQAQKMEAIGTLAGGVAHDFNNMLGGIIGATELLAQYLPQNTKAEQLHQTILDSALHAAELTKQLLTFSRQSSKASTTVKMHEVIKDNYQAGQENSR